jgi:gluconate/galactonate dehydratase
VKIAALHTAVAEGNYDWTYIRIDTDADVLSGLGECYTAPGLTAIVRPRAAARRRGSPRCRPAVRQAALGASGAGSPAGIVYNAVSGMEAAL